MFNQKQYKILIVGGGGREHALAWRCSYEGHQVFAAPGSDGIAEHATCEAVGVGDSDGLIALVKREQIDFVIIGPEQPLVDGVADALRAAQIPVVGPSKEAAELEASKAYAKDFMRRHRIPTAKFVTVNDLKAGLEAIEGFETPPVVKASGLAAGKGVVVCETFEEAKSALRMCMTDKRFGEAGNTVVLEERLAGEEVSFFAITDGTQSATLLLAQDHKRLSDGDLGPNTGGMGAYAPALGNDARIRTKILHRILRPTLDGLSEDARPFVGVLFVGLIVNEAGDPKVIEYNVRFGDPETQALMFGLDEPIVSKFFEAATGQLQSCELRGKPTATVVLASGEYPQSSTKGVAIEGIEQAAAISDDIRIFHAGTKKDGETWRTNGGRVLSVTAKGETVEDAVALAYRAVSEIRIEGGQHRTDIGKAVQKNL